MRVRVRVRVGVKVGVRVRVRVRVRAVVRVGARVGASVWVGVGVGVEPSPHRVRDGDLLADGVLVVVSRMVDDPARARDRVRGQAWG